MTNVELSIAGRSYRVACSPGEEAHLQRLGTLIDSKIIGMGNVAGHSEARLLLYAALLLADELHEATTEQARRASSLEALAPSLEGLAALMESLATRVEEATSNA